MFGIYLNCNTILVLISYNKSLLQKHLLVKYMLYMVHIILYVYGFHKLFKLSDKI